MEACLSGLQALSDAQLFRRTGLPAAALGVKELQIKQEEGKRQPGDFERVLGPLAATMPLRDASNASGPVVKVLNLAPAACVRVCLSLSASRFDCNTHRTHALHTNARTARGWLCCRGRGRRGRVYARARSTRRPQSSSPPGAAGRGPRRVPAAHQAGERPAPAWGLFQGARPLARHHKRNSASARCEGGAICVSSEAARDLRRCVHRKFDQGVYLICVECVVAHHGRQLHIVSHQVHIRMTES